MRLKLTYDVYINESTSVAPLRTSAVRGVQLERGYAGGARCCGTADESADPIPRLSVLLQYFQMHVNVRSLSKWKSQCSAAVELIVNVDSRGAGDLRWLETEADHVIFSRNLHEERAYNKMARMARAPILLFAQDDEPPPRGCAYIAHMEQMLRFDPSLAIVGWRSFSLVPKGTRHRAHTWRGHRFDWRKASRHWWSSGLAAQYAAVVDVGPYTVRWATFM
jgi:hypothetical protein